MTTRHARNRADCGPTGFLVMIVGITIFAGLFAPAQASPPGPMVCAVRPFEILVVDAVTKRPVPLVVLRTTANTMHVTDNGGRVAFHEPGMMNQRVFFHVSSHGYEHPMDGFGYRGRAIDVEPGGRAIIELERINIAERLYRVTGPGLFRETIRLGLPAPIQNPLLNANVVGQDSVQAKVYRGQIHWFWGDTHRVRHPLGNFRTSGATSPLPSDTELPTEIGVDLTYFTGDDGFVRAMAPLPSKEGNLMWISGLLVTRDAEGRERLVAHYDHRASLGKGIGQGLLLFNDDTCEFEILQEIDPAEAWRRPIGQATRYQDGGRTYWLFVRPLPLVRVPDTFEAIQDRNQYEAFTCLLPGTRFDGASSRIERDADGRIVWGWKTNTDPVGQEQEWQLLQAGRIFASEARFQFVDEETSDRVHVQRSTAAWNEHVGSWILIGTQLGGGPSWLGEIWFASAPSPTGPWGKARRILTHDRYSFYNPALHSFLDEANGRYVYFEGTYTRMFSGDTPPTPYYEYNQILYRLDLDDPRLRSVLSRARSPNHESL